jgi:hypothetical protein
MAGGQRNTSQLLFVNACRALFPGGEEILAGVSPILPPCRNKRAGGFASVALRHCSFFPPKNRESMLKSRKSAKARYPMQD